MRKYFGIAFAFLSLASVFAQMPSQSVIPPKGGLVIYKEKAFYGNELAGAMIYSEVVDRGGTVDPSTGVFIFIGGNAERVTVPGDGVLGMYSSEEINVTELAPGSSLEGYKGLFDRIEMASRVNAKVQGISAPVLQQIQSFIQYASQGHAFANGEWKLVAVYRSISESTPPPNKPHIKVLITTEGDSYKNAIFKSADYVKVRFAHDDGVASVTWDKIKKEDQVTWGFDPEMAKTALLAQHKAAEEKAKTDAIIQKAAQETAAANATAKARADAAVLQAAQEKAAEEERRLDAEERPPKIMGICIGMDINKARNNLGKKISPNYFPSRIEKLNEGVSRFYIYKRHIQDTNNPGIDISNKQNAEEGLPIATSGSAIPHSKMDDAWNRWNAAAGTATATHESVSIEHRNNQTSDAPRDETGELCGEVIAVNGKITSFDFTDESINDLFGKKEISNKDFINAFMAHYNIPEFKALKSVYGWEYTSLNGVNITITAEKAGITIGNPTEPSLDHIYFEFVPTDKDESASIAALSKNDENDHLEGNERPPFVKGICIGMNTEKAYNLLKSSLDPTNIFVGPSENNPNILVAEVENSKNSGRTRGLAVQSDKNNNIVSIHFESGWGGDVLFAPNPINSKAFIKYLSDKYNITKWIASSDGTLFYEFPEGTAITVKMPTPPEQGYIDVTIEKCKTDDEKSSDIDNLNKSLN